MENLNELKEPETDSEINPQESVIEEHNENIEGGKEGLESLKKEVKEKETGELKKVREDIKENKNNNESDKKEEDKEADKEKLLENILEELQSFDEKFEDLKKLSAQDKNVFRSRIKGLRNNLSQRMIDRGLVDVKPFADDIVKKIEEISGLENIKLFIAVGTNDGRIEYEISQHLPNLEKAILIDPNAAPLEEVTKNSRFVHLGQDLKDVKIKPGTGGEVLVEASNFLQLFTVEEKKEMLVKMIELAGVGGKIIIVDEIERPGAGGIQDLSLNKIYNWGRGKYERLKLDEYRTMFEELGLTIKFTKEKYNRGSTLFMLEVTEDTMERIKDVEIAKVRKFTGTEEK